MITGHAIVSDNPCNLINTDSSHSQRTETIAMLKIGLTGGIACGKSTASDQLALLGAHRIDADRLARKVVEPGKPALDEITAEFGTEILHSEGGLDRKALGKLVFSDPGLLNRLNAIIHPYIFREQEAQIAALASNSPDPSTLTILVDAALMIEAGRHTGYDLVIVVYCPERIQLERLKTRNGFSREQARQRILRQMPAVEKVDYADFVVNTAGPKAETRRQIEHLWKLIQSQRSSWIGRRRNHE